MIGSELGNGQVRLRAEASGADALSTASYDHRDPLLATQAAEAVGSSGPHPPQQQGAKLKSSFLVSVFPRHGYAALVHPFLSSRLLSQRRREQARARVVNMWVFYMISLPLTVGMVAATLRYFAGPAVPPYVLAVVGYAWLCSLSFVVLVPTDIWTVRLPPCPAAAMSPRTAAACMPLYVPRAAIVIICSQKGILDRFRFTGRV
jgi:hypothetical protein